MSRTKMHQQTPIIVSHELNRRAAHEARSEFLAGLVVALGRSIRDAVLAYGNRFKVGA